jgi:hypothetical protein
MSLRSKSSAVLEETLTRRKNNATSKDRSPPQRTASQSIWCGEKETIVGDSYRRLATEMHYISLLCTEEEAGFRLSLLSI